MSFISLKLLIILSLVALYMTSCGSGIKNTTLFLKEEDSETYNLVGENCVQSGHIINNIEGTEEYRMTTYFFNCDVTVRRKMKTRELKQWGLDKSGKFKVK